MLIPFAGPPGHFPTVSYVEALRGELPPGVFADKLVLVGATATGMGDELPTPFSGHERPMSGVELHATVLDALHRGLVLRSAPDWLRRLLTGLAVLLPLLAYSRLPPRAALVLSDVSTLREAERLRSEALGFLSHDLRSPLASVLAAIAVARATMPAGPWVDKLDRAERHAERVLELADQFLAFARLDHAEPERGEPLDLADVAREAHHQVWSQAQAQSIELHYDDPGTPAPVLGDADQLTRAFVNLLSNATTYCPAGSRVDLELRTQADEIHCVVRDDGPGIPATELPRLFERYRRASTATASGTGGAGLGLAFVKRVADRHGGRVSIESEVGIGSTFTLVVPRARP